jgi:hypothetical protein
MGLFTRSILDRCFCAFLSLLLMAPTGWGLYTYFTLDHSGDNPDWMLRVFVHVGMEIVGAAFVLSVLGVIWAVFAPEWLETAMRFCAEHFIFALAAFLFVIGGMLAFSFLA